MEKYLKITRSKQFLTLVLLASMGMNIYFTVIRNPLLPENTVSLIGLEYPLMLFFWCLFNGLAFFYNSKKMYEKYDFKNKFCNVLVYAAAISIIVVFLVPASLVPGIQQTVHWAGAIGFAVFNSTAIILFFLLMRKKVKGFTSLCVVAGIVALGMLSWLLLFGKSGLLESVPVFIIYIVFFLVNCTKLFTLRNE